MPSKYNDGVANIYKEKPITTDFSAKKNVSALENMDFIVKLAFEEKSNRQQDLEFADKMDFSLSLKIKTRLIKAVKNNFKAVIDRYLYNISHIDYDKAKMEMYLYLEGVKALAEND